MISVAPTLPPDVLPRHPATRHDVPVTPETARRVSLLLLAATVVQLVVASLVPGLPQFEGKGFAARLALYPVLMLLVPALWWLRHRRAGSRHALTDAAPTAVPRPPWTGFAVVMAPFLVDVTGNSLDLYDRVVWWDDANHLVNWFLLCLGLGMVLLPGVVAPRWVVAALVTGGGALLAVVWELGEWFTFIRHGTELATAYEDTLGDEALGSTGAALAAAVLVRWRSAREVEGDAGAGSGAP
jgi:hypothetical protein